MAEAKLPPEPMNVWDILDGSVRLYRRHFWPMAGASVVLALAGYVVLRLYVVFADGIVGQPPPGALTSTGDVPALLFVSLGAIFLGASVGLVEAGVLALIVNDAYLDGHASLGAVFKRLRIWSLIAACFLATCLIGVGFVLLLVPGIYLAINFTLVPIVAAVEGVRPVGTLKRSWSLVRARMARGFWNNNITRIMVIWAFLLVLGLLSIAIQGCAVGILLKFSDVPRASGLRSVLNQVFQLPTWIIVAAGLFGRIVQAFFRPFALCALVLLYYDIRVKKEGVDIGMKLDGMATAQTPGVRTEAGGHA